MMRPTSFLICIAMMLVFMSGIIQEVQGASQRMDSTLVKACKLTSTSEEDFSMCLHQFKSTQMDTMRTRRAVIHHKPCQFCSTLSLLVRASLLRDERGNPALGIKIKALCNALISSKLARYRCYIISEIIRDPYSIVADVLSPETCYNVPCPSDMKGRVSRQLFRKNNCEFCKKLISRAKRDISFLFAMVKRISRDLDDGCTKSNDSAVLQDCQAGKGAVTEIEKYLRDSFQSEEICWKIEIC